MPRVQQRLAVVFQGLVQGHLDRLAGHGPQQGVAHRVAQLEGERPADVLNAARADRFVALG
jgi:hypothetical protein